MAKKSQYVQVGKRKIEISNLSKLIYPEDEVIKAEIIQYYLSIAPTILRHIKGRPLTLIRYPEGIDQERFYQKNRPDWAPTWLDHVKLGTEEKKDYLMATEDASLVWLANLACLELHQMHSRKPHFDKPDYFVLDLDPPEGYDYQKIIEVAFDLKTHVESFGYTAFVKSTGGKGFHLCVPVTPKWDFHTVFEAALALARPFVEKRSAITTLHIKKEARKGRILIDVYRNRRSQTIVSPYSLRGTNGAAVSMPLRWQDLESLQKPTDYNIHNALNKVVSDGDAWEAINGYAVGLHTEEPSKLQKVALGASEKHKTPEQLLKYQQKRDFDKTNEPKPQVTQSSGNDFVIHRHHASRLHYDLRLEKDGVLRSWAVPRGLPQRPGIKRLAVATEDHPIEYLHFEGVIPKGEYGAGAMWVFAHGKYEVVKEKKNGFYFNLYGEHLNAEYRIHATKDQDWMLERVDQPQIDLLKEQTEPMLAESMDYVPLGDYIYEVKWDGIRAVITIDEDSIRILSRNKRDITHQFPELLNFSEYLRVNSGIFDAEIVCLDEDGRPNFGKVITRLQKKGENSIKKGSQQNPVYCYLFDCLYLDGRSILHEPLLRRREWLKDSIKHNPIYRMSEFEEDGEALFAAARKMQLEGIMAKEKGSIYKPGRRSAAWQKIKVRNTTECIILGYTQGKGDRQNYFGALQLGQWVDNTLVYRGKVGTGFDIKKMKSIYQKMERLKQIERPVEKKPVDDALTVWIEPKLICEISFSSFTENDTYREPVFLHLRPDLSS